MKTYKYFTCILLNMYQSEKCSKKKVNTAKQKKKHILYETYFFHKVFGFQGKTIWI